MENSKYYTLITGASQGIGKAFALECAKRGMNLFLVALPNHFLNETEKSIREKYPVDVITLGVDLTDPDAPRRVYEFSLENFMRVNFLINNAGLGPAVFSINPI